MLNFAKGIKTLSLFFIDEVAKYRDYSAEDEKGEYARLFEEEYERLKQEYLEGMASGFGDYPAYLRSIDAARTHNGYFSVDKKKRVADTSERSAKTDVDAYDLILKDKERLLSLAEETRFIFSHSALREGWDNPNVFVMCMLKNSQSGISRRQEVGRGLRFCVDKNGVRYDDQATVHDVNILTVIANESYEDFVNGLQEEMAQETSSRQAQVTESYLIGLSLEADGVTQEMTPDMAKLLHRWLIKHDYTDKEDRVNECYQQAKTAGTLSALPEPLAPFAESICKIIDQASGGGRAPEIENARKTKNNPRNDRFYQQEFRELWGRINKKAFYRVNFESNELINSCIAALNKELRVTPLEYVVKKGEQLSADRFKTTESRTESMDSVHSQVQYDLIGKIGEATGLTRGTIVSVPAGIEPHVFDRFKMNPEQFMTETARLMNEQKSVKVIEHLTYHRLNEIYDIDIFTVNQTTEDFSRATEKLRKHIYDYVVTDSDVERSFVSDIDVDASVAVYVKLPKKFSIPTPVGNYNPDWAIAFHQGSVKHIYFVAETKGSLSTLELRREEEIKIECARKFFDAISRHVSDDRVKYDVVTSYEDLCNIVS